MGFEAGFGVVVEAEGRADVGVGLAAARVILGEVVTVAAILVSAAVRAWSDFSMVLINLSIVALSFCMSALSG